MHEYHVRLVKIVHIFSMDYPKNKNSVSSSTPDSEKIENEPQKDVVLVVISKMHRDLTVSQIRGMLSPALQERKIEYL